jgi:ABC-2 type transport system permease protein
MDTALAIAKREFKTFFQSPLAYIVIGAFLVFSAFFFFIAFFPSGVASMRNFFGLAPLIFMVFVPAVTMRLVAEERKTGTLELLLSMPVKDWQVVVGKFAAALGVLGVGLLWTVPFAVSVASLTAKGASFDWGPVIGGYLGLLLMASSFVGLGLWGSALSRNQIVGFIVGLVLTVAFSMINRVALVLPESLGEVFQYLSVDYHFENIARGVFDTRDILFYLSLTAAGLVLTTRTLATARQ